MGFDMNKTIRLSLLAAALAVTGSANALDFQTIAGTPFTSYFSVTPTLTNNLSISISGTDAQYSALSFEILSGGPSVVAGSQFGNLVAAFNDRRNGSFLLTAGSTYMLKIDGITKAAPPGTFGIVSITALNGSVTPVPEPENYAMLLAGLGLIGTIARRRKSKTV